jgi:hypothetical protein
VSQTSGPPPTVIESFSLEPDSIDRLAVGLINETYAADRTDGSACILQRVSSIFPPEITDDIEAVTEHLSAKGLPTPQLVATTAGHNRLEAGGDIWRLLTRIEGETVEALGDADAAREAGRVVGAFHQALAGGSFAVGGHRFTTSAGTSAPCAWPWRNTPGTPPMAPWKNWPTASLRSQKSSNRCPSRPCERCTAIPRSRM